MKNWSSSRVYKLTFAALLGCSAVAVSSTANAQDSGAAESGLDEVIVTARKRQESLQDVPVAISVFTGTALKQAGITSARELYENTPGLNYDTGFDQNAATPAIRGVTSSEIATYRQKVTTFLDGMPILGQQGSVPFAAIRQVEVLRGPQSAAFGRSTFGGAINYTTRDPGEVFESEINLEVGSDGLLNADALVAAPLSDKAGFLVAGSSNVIDGESDWKTIAEGETLGGQDSKSVLAKLLFAPTDKISFELRYKWLDVDNEQTARTFMPLNDPKQQLHPDSVVPVCGGGIVPPPQPSCAYVGSLKAFDADYDYNYALTGVDSPFVRNERDRFEVEGNFDLNNGASIQALGFVSDEYYERATDSNLTNDAFGFERDPTDIEETYAEVRYTSAGAEKFRYGFGVSYYDYDFLTLVYRSRAAYDGGPASANLRLSESATNTGVFFSLAYDVSDLLTLSLEGRSQSDDVTGSAIQTDGSLFELGQKTDAFLPRLSLTFAPSDSTTFYVQASKGNNPAGVNVGAVSPYVIAASEAYPEIFDSQAIAFFDEEEVVSVELGVKGKFGNRGTYAVNVYKLNWDNYTQPFNLNFEPGDFVDLDNDGVGDVGTTYEGLDFGPGRSFLDAGDATGQGLELEGTYQATDDFRIGLAASYIDITYDNGACSTLPLDFGVPANEVTGIGLPCVSVKGNELGTQPKLSGSLTLYYSHELSNGMEWFTRWNTRYNSSQYVSEMNLAKLGAYSISDLRVGLSKDQWRAELYVTNVFDEDAPQGPQYFFDGRILTPAGTPAPPPFAQNVSYTDRRAQAFGARFSYNFGG
jgi:iron complex outermembrane receptor protein